MSLFRKLITELAERIDPETAEAKKNEQGETLTAYRTRLRSLVDKGCESFYREIYGDRYVDGWANHHREAINWHWDGRLGFLKIAERQGVLESEIKAGDITREEFQTLLDAFIKEHKAKYLAYFPIWSRGHAKCVDENTQVLMADGTRKAIKNVFIGDKVLSFDRTSGRLIEQKVKGKWEAGIKKCVTVKTRTGWELTATTDHAVLTFDGWKTVGELTEQDRIASPRRIPTGSDVLWDEVVSVVDAGERNTYDISVSNTENFIADGLVTHNSTHAEHLVVTDAMLSWAFDQPGFCLYVCREKTKVIEHVSNIEELLSSPKVKEYCPLLSQVQVNDETGQKRQWTGRFLHTAAGYVVKGASTDSAQAGSRIKDTRVTFMVLDDVDGREKSLVISENRYNRISNELLPMRQWNTLVFWAQNLINEYTVMYSVYKQRRQMLTNRKPTQPVPAVIDLKAEQRTVDGIVKMVYISGEPTWHAWDADRIQDEMDSEGYDAFLRECQHEVEGKKEGRVFPRYDDGIHVITESEFAAVYGVRKPPRSWYKYFAHDWARTKTEFHANVAFWSAVSPQNAKRPGFFFIYDPMSFPEDTMPDTCAVRFLNTLQPSIYVQGTEYTWEELIQQTLLRENLERHITDTTKLIEARRTVLARIIPQYLRGYQTADGKKVEGLLDSHSVKKMRFSHDRDDINRIYNQTYGFRFDPCNPGEKGGVSQINELMRVDYTHEHPFKPGVFGYTRFFIIVPDEKADRDEISPVKDLHDHDLLRHQMINRRTLPAKLTEAGEVNIDTYEKANDDFGQSLQFLFFDNAPFNEPLTREEKTEEVMRHEAPELSVDVIEALPDSPQKGQAVQARLQKIKEVQAGLIRGEGRFKNPMKRVRRNY